MPKPDDAELLTIDGHTVRVSSPNKLYFSRETRITKLEIVQYFLAVAPGALGGISDRPIVLKRFVNGACLAADQPDSQPEPFYQKRAPADLPPFLRTVTLAFPSGRTAEEVVVDNPAALAWVVNLGCMELHPHPVRSADLDHPDQLRVDLDPQPGVDFAAVRLVALEVKALLDTLGLHAFPKTSGSRGIHINVPIHPRWSFTEVRRAALALARAVERRVPTLASSKWWKEERHGVFLDYNQNAKDRTTASAYSVRPLPDARVSAPLLWPEVADCNPADFTVLTMPARFATIGDPHMGMDTHAASLDPLLELAARDEHEGLGDAPWPPHFAKQEGEAKRVAPSKAKKFSDQLDEGFGPHRFKRRSKSLASTPAPDPAALSDPNPPDPALPPDQLAPDQAAPTDPETDQLANDKPAPASRVAIPGRKARVSAHPLITIANSPDKSAALAGLDRWTSAHPEAAAHLAVDDILIDRMRGRSYIWYRIRLNLRNVPVPLRPPQQTPDPDDDPTR